MCNGPQLSIANEGMWAWSASQGKIVGPAGLKYRYISKCHCVYVAETLAYSKALDYSLRFYEAQRSGILPADNRIPWRSASNTLDQTLEGLSLVRNGYMVLWVTMPPCAFSSCKLATCCRLGATTMAVTTLK